MAISSYPREETVERRVAGGQQAAVPSPPARDALISALRAYEAGNAASVIALSPEEFEAKDLPVRLALAEHKEGDRSFRVRLLGSEGDAVPQTYVTERVVHATESWSPERWAYRAIDAEVQQASNVLRLTFERDLTGLIGLLCLDVLVGAVYGVIFGLIAAVLGTESIDKQRRPGVIPPPLPHPLPFRRRDEFRA
jgi:hypothetical protein